MEETNGSSFSSLGAYSKALIETPKRICLRAGSVSTTYEEMSTIRARSGSNMQKTLRWFDLVGFGIGGMVGAGVFVTTGRASLLYAGPAIVLSYAVAGLCALLSAFCYTEFAVDMPVAGGAFSYLRITFGEFAAFVTGANLVMEYVVSNAAIARSFTAYLGTSIGVNATQKWRVTVSGLPKGFNEIDFVAVAVVLIITVCICYSTKESSVLNMVLTAIHILFISFIIFIGFWRGDVKNFTEPSDLSSCLEFESPSIVGMISLMKSSVSGSAGVFILLYLILYSSCLILCLCENMTSKVIHPLLIVLVSFSVTTSLFDDVLCEKDNLYYGCELQLAKIYRTWGICRLCLICFFFFS
ncbi:hypothetical protein MKW94_030473, partial [Papaver nudicaule]|nr:hypothetical protein [Papaver nudicaule]